MYVKVQHGRTIKKLPIQHPETATLTQLISPLLTSAPSHFCLTVSAQPNLQLIINDDQSLQQFLQTYDAKSNTIKFHIRSLSEESECGSESWEKVFEMEGRERKERKLSLPSAWRPGCKTEEIKVVGWEEEEKGKLGHSMIEAHEGQLKEIKQNLIKTEQNILRIERSERLTDVTALLTYAYSDLS